MESKRREAQKLREAERYVFRMSILARVYYKKNALRGLRGHRNTNI